MAKSVSLILILIILAAAVFGFAVFTHEMDEAAAACPFIAMPEGGCPTDLLEYALVHLSALKDFFLTGPAASVGAERILLLALWSLVLSACWLFYLFAGGRVLSPATEQRRLFLIIQGWPPVALRLSAWLSLLEHSPIRN